MKAVCSWMFFGAMTFGLISGASPLKAQPARNSEEIDNEASTDNKPAAPTDEPAARDGKPPLSGGKPASLDGQPVTNAPAAILAINAPDTPWSRGVSMEDRRAARDLFLEGNRLFRIPLFAKAAEKYVVALGRWKHPVIYLNLAIAQLNAGQDVEARDSLQHALEYGEEPLGAENFQGAQLQLELVTRQLGRIRVTCRTPGAQVTLDGIPLFVGPGSYEGWVKAKDHEITGKRPEYLAEASRVTVTPGQLQDVHLKLITLSEATDASRRWTAWKPWAVTAVGGAVMVAGGVLHTLSYRNFRAFDNGIAELDCVDSTPAPGIKTGCSQTNITIMNSNIFLNHARRQQQIALVSYAAGGSLVAAGIVLLYMNQPRLERLRTMSAGTRSISLTPAVSNDMLGIALNVSR